MITPRENLLRVFRHENPAWIPVAGHCDPYSQPSREGMDPALAAGTEWGVIGEAEVRFHTTLTAACGNRLAARFAHLYEPIFQLDRVSRPTTAEVASWARDHATMVDALATGDEAAFLQALRQHITSYMHFDPARQPQIGLVISGSSRCPRCKQPR